MRSWRVGVAAVAVLVAGCGTGVGSGPGPSTAVSAGSSSTSGTSTGDTVGDRDVVADADADAGVAAGGGVGVVWPRSEGGARLAALSMLEVAEEMVSVSPAEAAVLQRGMSTVSSADRLAGEVEVALGALADAAPGGVEVWVAPLRVGSVPEGEGWRVSIWYVQVVDAGGVSPVASWNTATYVLVWESGGWKAAEAVSVVGPTPAPGAGAVSSSTELEAALSGFDDVDVAVAGVGGLVAPE